MWQSRNGVVFIIMLNMTLLLILLNIMLNISLNIRTFHMTTQILK